MKTYILILFNTTTLNLLYGDAFSVNPNWNPEQIMITPCEDLINTTTKNLLVKNVKPFPNPVRDWLFFDVPLSTSVLL